MASIRAPDGSAKSICFGGGEVSNVAHFELGGRLSERSGASVRAPECRKSVIKMDIVRCGEMLKVRARRRDFLGVRSRGPEIEMRPLKDTGVSLFRASSAGVI